MLGYSLSSWLEIIRYGVFMIGLFGVIAFASNKIAGKMLRNIK